MKEISRVMACLDVAESMRGCVELETIGQIIGARVGIAERGQIERHFNKLQDAAEIMDHMRHIFPGLQRHLQSMTMVPD